MEKFLITNYLKCVLENIINNHVDFIKPFNEIVVNYKKIVKNHNLLAKIFNNYKDNYNKDSFQPSKDLIYCVRDSENKCYSTNSNTNNMIWENNKKFIEKNNREELIDLPDNAYEIIMESIKGSLDELIKNFFHGTKKLGPFKIFKEDLIDVTVLINTICPKLIINNFVNTYNTYNIFETDLKLYKNNSVNLPNLVRLESLDNKSVDIDIEGCKCKDYTTSFTENEPVPQDNKGGIKDKKYSILDIYN